mgnify:CR=1 FL=1
MTEHERVIQAAREALARRAPDYVDLHFQAAEVAAAKGDARPIEWALSRIAEDGARIVDSEAAAQAMPSLSIGIALGGVRGALPAVTVEELPPMAESPELDTP